MDEIQKLAVLAQNNLVKVVQVLDLSQDISPANNAATVRQVKDSEGEAARQLTQQLHKSAPVCQVKDSEDDATKPARKKKTARKSTAPVRQVEDSEDEAVHQPIQHGSVVEEKFATQQVPCTQQPEKIPRPQIKLGVSQNDFSYFEDEWASYKRSCRIRDETETRDQL